MLHLSPPLPSAVPLALMVRSYSRKVSLPCSTLVKEISCAMVPDHLHLSLLLIKLANIWLGRASHSFLPGGLGRMIIAAAMNLLLVGSLIL